MAYHYSTKYVVTITAIFLLYHYTDISNPDLPSDKEKANSDEVTDLSFDFRTSPGSLSYAVSQSNSFEYRGSEEAQTSTPSMETVLIEMGFSHPQVSVAMER